MPWVECQALEPRETVSWAFGPMRRNTRWGRNGTGTETPPLFPGSTHGPALVMESKIRTPIEPLSMSFGHKLRGNKRIIHVARVEHPVEKTRLTRAGRGHLRMGVATELGDPS